MSNENFKRQYRELSPETRKKISQALVGRPKSDNHAKNISKGMSDYWASVPSDPSTKGGDDEK